MIKNKRFYYNIFYHKDDPSRVLEYEIIDRQSYPDYPDHDEKEDIPDWEIYISENDSGWQDMLINLLNQLNDENERLKQENQSLLKTSSHFNTVAHEDRDYLEILYNENKQLKQRLNDLKHEIHHLKHEQKCLLKDITFLTAPQAEQLIKENEQLKQFKQLVVDFIDQSLEKDKRYYETTYEDYWNGRIEALEELKKVIEND